MAIGSFLIRLLFSFRGRIKRLDYLLASLGLAVGRVVVLILALALVRGQMDDSKGLVVRLILDVGFFWPSAAIVIKRGHDRNKPAWLSGVVLAAVYGPGVAFGFLMDADHNNAGAVCALVVLAGWIYMLIDYGLIDGTLGPNRYGPSPKSRQAAGVGTDLAKVFD